MYPKKVHYPKKQINRDNLIQDLMLNKELGTMKIPSRNEAKKEAADLT